MKFIYKYLIHFIIYHHLFLISWIITSAISHFLYYLYFHFTGGRYLIAGGDVSGASDEMTEVVELVKTNSTPSFGQLPSKRDGAVGTMLGNAPILCGGNGGSSYEDACISYHQDSGWIQSHSLTGTRQNAAGVKVNSTTFWILGGYAGFSFLDSTEFIIQGQTNGVPGPKLPFGMVSMCAVKISKNEIFVIVGQDKSNIKNEVWIYDPQNGFARTQGPSLTTARSRHSCSTMKDGKKTLIVTAGGIDDYGHQLDSVEIYDPTENNWHSGNTNSQPLKLYQFLNSSRQTQF